MDLKYDLEFLSEICGLATLEERAIKIKLWKGVKLVAEKKENGEKNLLKTV